jgi:hypothetical protein
MLDDDPVYTGKPSAMPKFPQNNNFSLGAVAKTGFFVSPQKDETSKVLPIVSAFFLAARPRLPYYLPSC